MIPYSRQIIGKSDISAVNKTLKSNYLTQGPKKIEFEKLLSKTCSSKYSVTFNSATSALHIACLSLGVGKGDYVWTCTNSFVASANCALYCQANIDLVDINLQDFNMCMSDLEKKLIIAKKKKKLPKVIIPIHFGGLPPDLKIINKLKKKYKFKVIEDASHALGSKNENNITGNCKWADITVFSFHPVKIITTGEGGALTTNSRVIYNKIKVLTNNGVTKNFNDYKKKINKKWYYEQHYLSLNFRMSDINAALGLSQAKKINFFVKKRNQIARNYNRAFSGLDMKLPKLFKDKYSSFHLYVIKIDKSSRNRLFDYLIEKKINVNLHYLPVHLQPLYENMKFKKTDLLNSEEHALTAISLPMFPDLKKNEQTKIIRVIKLFFKKNRL